MKKLFLFTLAYSFGVFLQAQSTSLISQYGFGSSLADRATDVKYHPDQDIVVYGTFSDNMDFNPSGDETVLDPLGNPDIFLGKYTAEGSLAWVLSLGRIALNNGMTARAMAIDGNGDILITGGFSNTVNFNPLGDTENVTSEGGVDAFLAKYNSEGLLIWVQSYGTPSSETGTAIAVGSDNAIFLGLRYNADIDVDLSEGEEILLNQGGSDAAVLGLTANGDFNFSYEFSTPGNDAITEIASSPNGSGYLGIGATVNGALSGLPEKETFLSVHESNGALLWDYNFDNIAVFNEIADIQFENDKIYVAGRFQGSTDFDPDPDAEFTINPLFADPFLAKYSADNGALDWARSAESSGTEDYAAGILLAGQGVFMVGSFDNTAIFVPGDFTTQVSSNGGQDIFLSLYYKSNGDFVSVETYGGSGNEFVRKVDAQMDGEAVLAGEFSDNLALNPAATPIDASGFSDVFFAEFEYQQDLSTDIWVPKEAVSVFPVPAQEELNFSLPEPKGSLNVKVISVVGVEVANYHFNKVAPTDKIDLSNLNTGIYIIEFAFDGQRISKRFVKQ